MKPPKEIEQSDYTSDDRSNEHTIETEWNHKRHCQHDVNSGTHESILGLNARSADRLCQYRSDSCEVVDQISNDKEVEDDLQMWIGASEPNLEQGGGHSHEGATKAKAEDRENTASLYANCTQYLLISFRVCGSCSWKKCPQGGEQGHFKVAPAGL